MKDLSYIKLFPKFYCAAKIENGELEFVISDGSKNLSDIEMSLFTAAIEEAQRIFREKQQQGYEISPMYAESILQQALSTLTRQGAQAI